MAKQIVLTYMELTLSGGSRYVIRYFRSPRALVQFTRTRMCVQVLHFEEV